MTYWIQEIPVCKIRSISCHNASVKKIVLLIIAVVFRPSISLHVLKPAFIEYESEVEYYEMVAFGIYSELYLKIFMVI